MGFFGKMKDLIGIEEIEDDEDITEEEIQAAMEQEKAKTERQTFVPAQRQDYREKSKPLALENKEAGKPAPMGRVSSSTTAMKLVVIEPSNFDECPKLVDNLKARKPIIINLANLDSSVARKIFDFLSGAVYALNGNIQRIADGIFVFAPENVDIAANIEHAGFDFDPKKNTPWRY